MNPLRRLVLFVCSLLFATTAAPAGSALDGVIAVRCIKVLGEEVDLRNYVDASSDGGPAELRLAQGIVEPCDDDNPPPPPPPCQWRTRTFHGVTRLDPVDGQGGGTRVEIEFTFRYGCEGGPQVLDENGFCAWAAPWGNDGCFSHNLEQPPGTVQRGVRGEFSGPNQHALIVDVFAHNDGSGACLHTWENAPAGYAPGNHCEAH